MFEHRLRMILVGAMFAALLLDMNWIGIVGYSIEYSTGLMRLFYTGPIGHIIHRVGHILFLLNVPILILSNILLIAFPVTGLKIFYRILLLVLLPWMWYELFQLDPAWRKGGALAMPAAATAAMFIEIAFIIRERRKEPENTGSAVE